MNEDHLFSDASSGYGMAGVLMFAESNKRKFKVDGLFWQLSWEEWRRHAANNKLCPGASGINTAEFLAALITCETFASYCSGRITQLAIDNFTAKSWLDRARCTRFPYDRCAQGVHLYMLEKSMKIRTRWIPSADNRVADTLSRKRFPKSNGACNVSNFCLRKVQPNWLHVLKFL